MFETFDPDFDSKFHFSQEDFSEWKLAYVSFIRSIISVVLNAYDGDYLILYSYQVASLTYH